MDTNILALLLAALQESKQVAPVVTTATSDTRTVVMVVSMILAAVSPVLAAMATYYAKKVAVVVEKVHTAVNSERAAMLQTVKDLRDEILRITKERTVLEEQKRERVDRDAARAEPPAVVGGDLMVRMDALLAKYEAPLVVAVKKPK